MKKYKTGGYGKNLIEEVECEKETTKTVWIVNERKGFSGEQIRTVDQHRKSSGYENYFDTWEDAHSYLLGVAKNKCSSVRRQLELANSHLGNIKGLKPRT